jgi:hypothetical protein
MDRPPLGVASQLYHDRPANGGRRPTWATDEAGPSFQEPAMPSQLIHLEVAADAWTRWASGRGAGRRPDGEAPPPGPFLLGAIAPDAWGLAGVSRQATHFWDPHDDTSGVVRLRRTFPQLTEPAGAEVTGGDVLAGYLCHLVTDEQWTFGIYRPYFGRSSRLQASAEAMRLQVVLQARLEERLRARRPAAVAGWLARLTETPAVAGLPFLADASIAAWRDLLVSACRLPSTPAAFDHVLAVTGRAGRSPGEIPLAADWPALVARVEALVPPAAVAAFTRRAAAACDAVLAERWGDSP